MLVSYLFLAVTLLPGDPSLMETTITKEEKRISELLDKLQSLLQTHQVEMSLHFSFCSKLKKNIICAK